MAEGAGEKTHDATPHRRQQAREKGQVAHSQDLASATLLIAAVGVLMYFGGTIAQWFGGLFQSHLGGEAWLWADRDFVVDHWNFLLSQLAAWMLPILGLTMLVGIAVSVFQVGFLFVPERLAPDITRLDPLKGLSRMFSLTSSMRLAFGVFKVLVVGLVAFFSLYAERYEILALAELEAGQIAMFVAQITLSTCLKIGLALFILALLDYTYQRWKHDQDLRMTQQEIREEMKNLQGDPQIIARRRAVQRQLIMNRLSDVVPKADVVITNPTELAIAIGYDIEKMAAPIVLAKGAGVIAQRIRRLALEHDIPIVEKKPLARKLYQEVDINHPIPSDLYAAVAEVLAFVYQVKGKPMPKAPH